MKQDMNQYDECKKEYDPRAPIDRGRSTDIEEIFTYHPVSSREQQAAYEQIRFGAKLLAECILRNTPHCVDQQEAIRKLRECVMTANASIALKGLV